MQPFARRTWRKMLGVLIPVLALMVATPAVADRDGRHHHKEWRHHDRGHDRGYHRGYDRRHDRDRARHWRHGSRKGHHFRNRHAPRVVIVKPRPRVIHRHRRPPPVYYVEPRRYRYYQPVPGVSGSVTFRF